MPNPTDLEMAIAHLKLGPATPKEFVTRERVANALIEIEDRLRALEAKKPGKEKGAGK